ncbi:YveK family protein [Listeria grandensis]|nr:Wzz/FepE/Etk N-terminal domain-containing protein [Listeria grandensis]
MEKMIDIRVILRYIRQNIWILALAGIIGLGVATIWVTKFSIPQYRATADILVKPQKMENEDFRLDANTNNRLISTYTGIIKSRNIMDQVKSQMKLQENAKKLSDNLEITNENDSQIISVSYTDESIEKAVDVVNKTVLATQKEVGKLIEPNSINILSKATIVDSSHPVSPNKKKSIIIGLIIGLFVGTLVTAIRILTNNTIREDEDIQEIVNIPVLGEVEKW